MSNVPHERAGGKENQNQMIQLSIVVPIYNEEKRINPTIQKLLAYLAKQSYSREIVLVDDGSLDRGIEVATKELEGSGEIYRVISYGENRGKGYALMRGMTESKGDYVLFTDADLSTPIEELDQMWHWFEQGFDIVQGSRKMPGAKVELHQPWLRENMGKVFTALSNLLVEVKVSDVTCGFKCYRGAVARHLYGLQRIYDWSFDAEVIHIARHQNFQLKEVPVRWHDERGTKVHLVRDTIRSLQGLLNIRLNNWRGLYNAPLNNQAYPIEQVTRKS
ncbi:MAG: dolichyl-phosphate beta-glucosyltransferase [Chloroflexota bacterium]|nr:glycosyltransferase family 2 protein [Chloroflexota bacterium]